MVVSTNSSVTTIDRNRRWISEVEYLIPLYRSLGDLEDAQTKVQLEIEEIPIPIIGYADFIYADKVRDMKCTGVMPKVRSDYSRQLAFYAMATKKKPLLDFVYTTTKRCELITLPVTNIEEHIKDVKRIAIKMMRLLSTSSDIHEVARNSYLVPDTTNEDFMKQWGPTEIKGAQILFKD